MTADNVYEEEVGSDVRELGHLAVWSVSSAKAGNGVDCLRDGRKDTFWQSDGAQPHFVNVQFQRMVELVELHLFLDFKLDESYTPSKVSIRAGSALHDLQELKVVDLDEPTGCTKVQLRMARDGGVIEDNAEVGPEAAPLRTFFIQVAVLTNHQNGRDTHIRLIRVYGPRNDPTPPAALSLPLGLTTQAFAMYATVR